MSIETQNISIDLKNLENLFDFSNLNENHELSSNIKKKVVGKVKTGTSGNIWIDEFVALRSKCYTFKCRDDSKNKLKGSSKSYSKNFEFDEYKKCLGGEEFQRVCDNYIIRSLNHEM